MSLSQWGASGSYLFLASELILAAATLSKAHEADSVGRGVCDRKLLFQREISLVGVFLLSGFGHVLLNRNLVASSLRLLCCGELGGQEVALVPSVIPASEAQ